MTNKIILASGSTIRREMLFNAGIKFSVVVSHTDEEQIKDRMKHANEPASSIVQELAIAKAMDVSRSEMDAFVIGCDQVLSFNDDIFGKPKSKSDAHRQLVQLRGAKHELLSTAAICRQGKLMWKHTGKVTLEMRDFSDEFLDGYLERNWNSIKHSVGGYKLEEEGVRLFSTIDGDYFTVLGMPLMAVLSYLTETGEIDK